MNRQQALNQLRIMQAWHEDFGNGPCPDYDAICYAINIIEEAPEGLDNLIKALEQEHKKLRDMQDVPPEKCEKCMMEHMDEMEKLEVELEMQKAQPEIIRCKDCKHNPKLSWFGCPMSHLSEKQRPETAWCWKAERRTDERFD